MRAKDMKTERGSGNVHEDLGCSGADAHLLKAELVARIDQIIRQHGLDQVEAARLLGLSQTDISCLLRGNFREYSMERLPRILMLPGCGVEIVIRQSQSHQGCRLGVGA